MKYNEFLERKAQVGGNHGFEPDLMPDCLFDFQRSLVEWSLRKGRSAIFADCGLGKTLMQLVWADNVHRRTGKPVLILTPLAVGPQTELEGVKFGIEAQCSREGKITAPIVITNYERLHYFDSSKFGACVCDESSILKNFDGVYRSNITEFMRKMPYRLLCTATAAPNDYIELGTSSEALGYLGFMDMLKMFFKSNDGSYAQGGSNGARRYSKTPFGGKFRFRGHAERDFWRWVCSWARAVRKPSDIGGDDAPFTLPRLITREHVVAARTRRPDMLFDLPAITLEEQRDERRRTLSERCELAAELIGSTDKPAVAWCHLNPEGDLLTRLIPGAVQVSGSDSDERKEEVFRDFSSGAIRVLVTKPTIAGWGLNWQHCAHQTFFPSHSFEQWYQSIRRSWRFGQTSDVTVDVITSEGERGVMENMKRKAQAADQMFGHLVQLINEELTIELENQFTRKQENPVWLSSHKKSRTNGRFTMATA